MPGETDLQKLLKNMSPELSDGEYIFLSFKDGKYGDHADLQPIAMMNEPEGLTLVVSKKSADESKQNYQSVFKCITLKIHSSLDAVGLTAAFSEKLTEHGMSANVVAGFYHDHILSLIHI